MRFPRSALQCGAAAVTLIRALVGHLGIQPGSGDHRHCHHQHHRHQHHHLHHLHHPHPLCHTHFIFYHLLIIIITASFGFIHHYIHAWQGYEAVSIIINTTNCHLLEMLKLSSLPFLSGRSTLGRRQALANIINISKVIIIFSSPSLSKLLSSS